MVTNLDLTSDLLPGTDIYDLIDSDLRSLLPHYQVFTFTTRLNSSSARSCPEAGAKTCPAITIYLRHNEDFDATGVDRHLGNWGDSWAETQKVRSAVNDRLTEFGYGDNHIDDHAFVFLDSVERLEFDRIGRSSKNRVADILHQITGVTPAHIFWSSARLYTIVFKDKPDYKRAKRRADSIEKSLSVMLKTADINKYCKNYHVRLDLGFGDMNLYHLARED